MGTIEKENKYILQTYARQPVVFVKGKGAVAYDEDGKEYIDLGSGIGVNSLGFCDEDWSNAVSKQASTLQHVSNLYYTKPMVDLAEALCKSTGYSRAFLCNSGAEANEGAIKLARKYSYDKYGMEAGRSKIVTLVNSFHGRTITTLSATGQDVFHDYFFPFTDGFEYVQANDIETLKQAVSDNRCCAVMLEFIQGEGGVIPLEQPYIDELYQYCTEHDILIIADEVQTGLGRTGKLLASEHYGIKPDITTLAKGLGGGLPIGAVLASDKTAEVMRAGSHGTTFGGNPVACAGANVVLKKISDENFLAEVTAKGEYIRKELSDLDEVLSIDGIGMMLGIKLKTKNSADVVRECIEKGCVPLTAKAKVRLLPPLNISQLELEKAVAILKEVLSQ